VKFLAIKNYRKHQHYHKRGAPWIKLYAATLTDAAFVQLPEAAQAQLMKLWLLASQFGHPLPNNPKLLAGKIGTTGKFHLAALVDAGFLIPCNEEPREMLAENANDASNDLAENDSSASASRRVPALARELEIELENRTTSSAPRPLALEAKLAAQLLNDHDRMALTTLLAVVPNRLAWIAELAASLEGMHGPALTPAQLGESKRDYDANGHHQNPSLSHFRSYMTRAAKAIPQTSAAQTTSGGGGASLTLSAIRKMVKETQQPGQGLRRFIPRADVERLGPLVLAAYDAIGGADRILTTPGDKWSFVIRDFAQALEDARNAA